MEENIFLIYIFSKTNSSFWDKLFVMEQIKLLVRKVCAAGG